MPLVLPTPYHCLMIHLCNINIMLLQTESHKIDWAPQTYILSSYKRWQLYVCAQRVISYQGAFFNLHFLVSSVDRISYRRGKKQKEKHSSPCLIHWAATVNVQQSGKDNFSQGRLPGTPLDHCLPSSLFSLKSMNKNAVKVCPIAKQHFICCSLRQNFDF